MNGQFNFQVNCYFLIALHQPTLFIEASLKNILVKRKFVTKWHLLSELGIQKGIALGIPTKTECVVSPGGTFFEF